MGDIVCDDLSIFPRYLSVVAHESACPGTTFLATMRSICWPKTIGSRWKPSNDAPGPPYYSFEYGGVHCVVLHSIDYAGNGESDPADIRGSGGYVARITERQLDWLENDLEHVPDDKLVLLAVHAPLRTYVGEPGDPRLNTQNRRELFELRAGRRHLYAVAVTYPYDRASLLRKGGRISRAWPMIHHHVLSTVSGS